MAKLDRALFAEKGAVIEDGTPEVEGGHGVHSKELININLLYAYTRKN